MAATLPRVLSFGKNTRSLLNVIRVSAAPSQRYSVEVSKDGEKITHTGQVTLIFIRTFITLRLVHFCLSLLENLERHITLNCIDSNAVSYYCNVVYAFIDN